MALQNHPALYTGGAERVNVTPYTNFAINYQQRQLAKDEALDNYYQNLAKGINPAGVRTVDMDGFMQKTGELQQFWQANKAAVKNPRLDGGRAQTELMSRYQDALAYIQQSKNEEAAKKPLIPIFADPEKRRLIPNSAIYKLQLHDLPLNHPQRKSLSVTDLNFDPKPLDLAKHIETFKDIKPDKMPTLVSTDKGNMTRTINTEYAYNDAAKQAVYERSRAQLLENPSFEKAINDLWSSIEQEGETSPTLQQYNDTFKKNYGRDIENEEDLAAAFNIGLLQQNRSEQEIKDDAFGRQKAMAYINDGLIRGRMKLNDSYVKGRMDYKMSKTSQQQQGILNEFIKRQIADGEGDPRNVTVNGRRYEGVEVKMPQFMTDKYSVKGKDNEWIEPHWIITRDSKYAIPYFTTDKKTKSGNPVIDPVNTKPILIETYKAELGKEWLSKNDIGGEVIDDFSEDDGDVVETQTNVEVQRTNESSKTQKPAKPTKQTKSNNDPLGILK